MNVDKEGLYVQEDVVISDKDEMVGEEYEDAVKSPLKGSGVCITSEISHWILLNYILTYEFIGLGQLQACTITPSSISQMLKAMLWF